MAEGDTKATLQLIQKDLSLPETEINLVSSPDMTQLHNYLSQAITELLNYDFNRLLVALYRIDVSEQKVAKVINQEKAGEIAPKLATLIIERELQKVITRKKYSGG